MSEKTIFKKKYVSFIAAVICTLLWGTAFPGVKLGYEWLDIGQEDTGGKLLFAGIRFFIAGLMVLAIYSVTAKKLPRLKKADIAPVISLALLQITGNYIFYYIGLSNTPGSKASILNSLDAFIVVLIAPLFFKKDNITAKKILGCLIGFTGIIAVNFKGADFGTFLLQGEGFILISALISSFAAIVNKRASSGRNPFLVTGYYLVSGSVFLIAIGLSLGAALSFASAKAVACLIYLSFVSAAAFTLWTVLLKYNNVSRISVFKLLIPVFGTVFSGLALRESILSVNYLIAVLCVAVGIWLVNITDKNSSLDTKEA